MQPSTTQDALPCTLPVPQDALPGTLLVPQDSLNPKTLHPLGSRGTSWECPLHTCPCLLEQL